MLNAVPQRDEFNSGIWLDLEIKTAEWADLYGSVWIITGPVFYDGKPRAWLGEIGEIPAAIPDALFKIVVKNSSEPDRPDVLGFIYPQEGPDYKKGSQYQHTLYRATVDSVERLTGLNFLTALPDSMEEAIESVRAETLWGAREVIIEKKQDVADEKRININTATKDELEKLPEIGPALAQRIIEGRPYGLVEDLLRVKGIGKATLERLKKVVKVQ
jgi:competence ComEA-like helix-hairpin-helix protein